MSIKVCGHEIRANKIIKVYTLVRHFHVLLVLGALSVTPAFAADTSPAPAQKTTCSSSAGAAPCLPLNKSRMDGVSPSHKGPPVQTQRSAGSTSNVPAMALFMAALGVRNVHGPVEYTNPRVKPAPQRVAMERVK